jgi:Zn-dependent protease
MTPTRQGSFHLFRFAGIDVYLHWSWFLVAAYEINYRTKNYSTLTWNVLEYLALFLIVLLHEYGHSLACRQVGGQANQIVLWPLGGVAYVDPPPRPGATLWSIAAGPLVNVVLLPVIWILGHWIDLPPNAYQFVQAIWNVNCLLLIFNLLPIYPLDGGQILRALLWFAFGRARSLMIATIIGLIGVAALIALAVWWQSVWFGIMAVFILLNCWGGLQQARALSRIARLPRRAGFACPVCRSAPFQGAFWSCAQCGTVFDLFETQAVCPHCRTQFGAAKCLDCGNIAPCNEWIIPGQAPPRL